MIHSRLWLSAGVALVVAGLAGALWVQSARLDARTAELAACDERVRVLGAAVREQNEAVDALRDAGAKASRRAQAALAEARADAESIRASEARLRALLAAGGDAKPGEAPPAPVPPPAAGVREGSCEHALAVVREDLGARP